MNKEVQDLICFTDSHVGNAMEAIRRCVKEKRYDVILTVIEMLEINRKSLLAKVETAKAEVKK